MFESNLEAGTAVTAKLSSPRCGSRAIRLAFVYLAALASSLATTPHASAFYEFARGELLLHTGGTVTYDSNVFGAEDAEDDILLAFNPELQYIRRAGRSDLSVRTGVIIGRFVDFTGENFENYYAELDVGYPVAAASRFGGGVSLSYRQTTGLSETLSIRTQTDRYRASINNTYRLNERVGLTNSFDYTRTERVGFRTVDSIGGSLGTRYFYSENLGFTLGYRLRRSTSSGVAGVETRESLYHAVTVGADGRLAPRVTGSVSAGAQTTQVIRGTGRERVRGVLSAGLTWAARPNTTASLDASRDQDLSGEGRSLERTSVSVRVTQRLTPKMSGYVSSGYRLSEFSGVETDRDHAYTAGTGLSYTFTDRWVGGLDYAFTHIDSERRDVKFERHTVALSTRYTF